MVEPITTTTASVVSLSWSHVLWNALLALLGGIVRLLGQKDKKGNVVRPTLWNLIGGMVCSTFIGIITLLLCESYGFEATTTGALVGISGYLGPYVIDIAFAKLQSYVDKKIERI
jgi:membrane associated rhomboid family serine protease